MGGLGACGLLAATLSCCFAAIECSWLSLASYSVRSRALTLHWDFQTLSFGKNGD